MTIPPSSESLDEAAIRAIVKGAFKIPALGGYGPFWELQDFEAKAISEPTARMVARLDPLTAALVNKVADPLTIIGSLVVLVSARMEMTRAYMLELKIQRETEARRAALSRHVEETTVRGGEPPVQQHPDGQVASGAADGAPRGGAGIADLFTSS